MAVGPPGMTERARVLLVEPDPRLSMAALRACVDAGLEPKMCRGPHLSFECPGVAGKACPRAERITAALIAIDGGLSRAAAPACAGGRPLLVCSARQSDATALHAHAHLPYPYDPLEAAAALRALATAGSP